LTGEHLLHDISRWYHIGCISQLIYEYIAFACCRLPIGVRTCSHGTSKHMACIMNRYKYSRIGKIWEKC